MGGHYQRGGFAWWRGGRAAESSQISFLFFSFLLFSYKVRGLQWAALGSEDVTVYNRQWELSNRKHIYYVSLLFLLAEDVPLLKTLIKLCILVERAAAATPNKKVLTSERAQPNVCNRSIGETVNCDFF